MIQLNVFQQTHFKRLHQLLKIRNFLEGILPVEKVKVSKWINADFSSQACFYVTMKYVDAGLEAVQQVLQEDSILFSKVHKTHKSKTSGSPMIQKIFQTQALLALDRDQQLADKNYSYLDVLKCFKVR